MPFSSNADRRFATYRSNGADFKKFLKSRMKGFSSLTATVTAGHILQGTISAECNPAALETTSRSLKWSGICPTSVIRQKSPDIHSYETLMIAKSASLGNRLSAPCCPSPGYARSRRARQSNVPNSNEYAEPPRGIRPVPRRNLELVIDGPRKPWWTAPTSGSGYQRRSHAPSEHNRSTPASRSSCPRIGVRRSSSA